MELTYSRIDLDAEYARDPEYKGPVLDRVVRSSGDVWYVVGEPIDFDKKPVSWRKSIRGDHVPVPMVPYLMPTDLDLALGFMVQMGVRVASSLGRPVKRLHLSTGVPVEEVTGPDGQLYWRYLMGFAILLPR